MFFKYCSQDLRQGKNIGTCLEKQGMNLTPSCQKSVSSMIIKLRASDPCYDSVKTLCTDKSEFCIFTLLDNMKDLPEKCQKKVQADIAKQKNETPCFNIIVKHCRKASALPVHYGCVKKYEKKADRLCLVEIESMEKELVASNRCFKDTQKFCKEVPRGLGRIYLCLKKNEKKLSSTCQKLFVLAIRS
jgi:hypothetical protein